MNEKAGGGSSTGHGGPMQPCYPADSLGKHYHFDYKGIRVDPYRIFRLYNITAPEQQHAIKKLLRAGESVKPLEQDIREVIATLDRWLDILAEDKDV